MAVDDVSFDANFDEDPDPPLLPSDSYFYGYSVTEEGRHQARMQFLVAIQTYKPADGCFRPNTVIRGLHDVLPVYRETLTRWLELHEDVPKWKTGIPWLVEAQSPIFSDLWAGIKEWARKYHLIFENGPAEWVLEHVKQNLIIWAMPSLVSRWREADPQWCYLDAFVGDPRIRGEWIKIFYNPLSMTHEDARAEFDRQIEETDARAVQLGARPTAGLVKHPSSGRFYDENGKVLKIPRHVEWFMRRQVCGESFQDIVNELPLRGKDNPKGYDDPDAAVRRACRDIARLIGLTPRQDKPGPKGKHSRLGK
jgi:hypothetical protein